MVRFLIVGALIALVAFMAATQDGCEGPGGYRLREAFPSSAVARRRLQALAPLAPLPPWIVPGGHSAPASCSSLVGRSCRRKR